MQPTHKKIIASIAVALIAGALYYGTYLPYRKSRVFITALQTASRSTTLEDLKSSFSQALDTPSPVGQEELVRSVGDAISGIIRNNVADPGVMQDLIDYLDGYYNPIIERGRGLSFTQNLYLLGLLREVAAIKINAALADLEGALPSDDRRSAFRALQATYLAEAEEFFLKGLELSPRRPQFLYGLFDIYRFKGDHEKARFFGEEILAQWPTDERIRDLVDALPGGD